MASLHGRYRNKRVYNLCNVYKNVFTFLEDYVIFYLMDGEEQTV